MKRFYWLVSFTFCFFILVAVILNGSSRGKHIHSAVPPVHKLEGAGIASSPPDTVHGLIGKYYSGQTFDTYVATRIDSVIQFDWGSGSPMPGKIGNNDFSVRWTGYIKAPVTGTYTFYTNSDDGARVIINGVIFIDYWGTCCREFSGKIFLEAGKLYPFTYEMREGGGGANARYLQWEAPGLSRELVPNSAFYAIAPPPISELPKPDVSRDTTHGLIGSYYHDPKVNAEWFDTLVATRIDAQMNFDWRSGSAMPGRMKDDYFSVRWEGYIRPPVTGTYTFHTWTDDGSRLYIAGEKIIDYWPTCCSDHSGTIDLKAGILYHVMLEMHEIGGGAGSHYLRWEAPGLPLENIPNSAYYTVRLQTVTKPKILPVSAIYVDSVKVSMNTLTNGADIHYTLDGSEPTESSPLYSGPITIKEDAKIKVKAFHKGMVPSLIASSDYRIIPPLVSTPTFTPTQGIYGEPIKVEIKTEEDSTVIYYTLDGSNPDSTSMVFKEPIEIDSTTRVKAYATKSGLTPSEVASATFTMLPPAAKAPEFSVPEGEYADPQEVTITSATADAVIHYAINNEVLNDASPVYTSPVKITKTTTLKAYAYKDGLRTSEVTMATYTIGHEQAQVDTPRLSLPGGHYNSIQQVAINTNTKEATIYYTTDGSTPNDRSTEYFAPILIDDSVTIKAYAAKPGMTPSDIVSVTYVVTGTAKDTTGIISDKLPTPKLTIAPNPATDQVRISWEGMIYNREGAYVTVTDSKGVIMKQVNIKGGYTYYDLNTTTFASGVYFVRIRSGQSVVYGKLIIGR